VTKSRAEELNPRHTCGECGVEHIYIPPLTMPSRNPAGEEVVDVPLIPLEITVVADGLPTFTTQDEPYVSSPVPVVALLWGVAGNPTPAARSVLVMN